MLWHDYGTWDEVTKAIDDLYEHNPDFAGVRHIRGTSLVIRPGFDSAVKGMPPQAIFIFLPYHLLGRNHHHGPG